MLCKDCGRASVGNTLATRGRGTGAWLAAPPHALLLCKELTLEIPEALLNLIEIPAALLLCKELLLNLVVLGLEGSERCLVIVELCFKEMKGVVHEGHCEPASYLNVSAGTARCMNADATGKYAPKKHRAPTSKQHECSARCMPRTSARSTVACAGRDCKDGHPIHAKASAPKRALSSRVAHYDRAGNA